MELVAHKTGIDGTRTEWLREAPGRIVRRGARVKINEGSHPSRGIAPEGWDGTIPLSDSWNTWRGAEGRRHES